jgi:hypothetical protein
MLMKTYDLNSSLLGCEIIKRYTKVPKLRRNIQLPSSW